MIPLLTLIVVGIIVTIISLLAYWKVIDFKKAIVVATALILAGAGIQFLPLPNPPTPPAASTWYSGFTYRKLITINHSQVSSDPSPDNLTNFPVLVYISSDSYLKAHAQTDGDDIVFVAMDNETKYNSEKEMWNITGNGDLYAWVNVTTVYATVDTTFWLYYGNASVGNQDNATGVWDNYYVGVWHMNESDPLDIEDSTSYNNDVTLVSGTFVTDEYGVAGYCVNITGSTSYLSINDANSLSFIAGDDIPLTMEAWGKNAESGGGGNTLISKYLTGTGGEWILYNPTGSEKFRAYFRDSSPSGTSIYRYSENNKCRGDVDSSAHGGRGCKVCRESAQRG